MIDMYTRAARSQMIDLPAGRFHYLSWNAEQVDAPGVLLLHGLTSSAESWTRVGAGLAGRYRVYALDQRGHGQSIKPAAAHYSLREAAADAAAFLAALALERVSLVGHSWGGAVALLLASGYGSSQPAPAPVCSHVILEEPASIFKGASAEEVQASIKDAARPAAELRAEIAASYPAMSEAEIEGRIAGFRDVAPEAITGILSDVELLDSLFPLLAAITAPTLLLRSDPARGSILDAAAWEEARGYLSANSQALQIAGATHTIHWSAFDAWMRSVQAFLEENDGQKR